MSYYLKISSHYFKTDNPKIIHLGVCEGLLNVVPLNEKYDILVNNLLKSSRENEKKYIFICESPKMILSRLIPIALGFIFREGSNLSHLANNLRYHQITSCIDSSLWTQATNAFDVQNQNINAEFCCGNKKQYSSLIKSEYRKKLEFYHHKIAEDPVELPIFDIQKLQFINIDKEYRACIGYKAFSINALIKEHCMVPNTIVFSNIRNDYGIQQLIDIICKIVKNNFSEFEQEPDFALMVRASVAYDRKLKHNVSGILSTSSVQTQFELEEIIRRYLKKWSEIQIVEEQFSLNIIIQKRIPTSILGVLFTRLPWDLNSNTIICDLIDEPDGNSPSTIQICIDDSKCQSGDDRKVRFYMQLSSQIVDIFPAKLKNELFYCTFSEFLCRCIELQNRYMVPLDIEFAITEDFMIYFTQFRYIHYM